MDQKPSPAEKVRGDEIILNTPLGRAVYPSGGIKAIVLAAVLMPTR